PESSNARSTINRLSLSERSVKATDTKQPGSTVALRSVGGAGGALLTPTESSRRPSNRSSGAPIPPLACRDIDGLLRRISPSFLQVSARPHNISVTLGRPVAQK